MGRADRHRDLEIVRHADAEPVQPRLARQLRQQGENKGPNRTRTAAPPSTRRSAAPPPVPAPAARAARQRQTPPFCGSSPILTWMKQSGRLPLSAIAFGQGCDERRAIDRMDRVEQRHGVRRLVRLKLPDQMQTDIVSRGLERGPFRRRLLHPVLAEHALASIDQRLDRGGVVRLGHGDQRDVIGAAAGDLCGLGDP
jgi:hypothetical protein